MKTKLLKKAMPALFLAALTACGSTAALGYNADDCDPSLEKTYYPETLEEYKQQNTEKRGFIMNRYLMTAPDGTVITIAFDAVGQTILTMGTSPIIPASPEAEAVGNVPGGWYEQASDGVWYHVGADGYPDYAELTQAENAEIDKKIKEQHALVSAAAAAAASPQ